ncbi:neutral zinc metallopeptidase [Planomonospora sp. ID82291]|uniref:neutral zinc metallopeptidase n=1 Tax=Planomonospora sp. ID82291 TaxID=2738136 RepID=UPI0018C436CA|nr:neutral zinc metallopeptidase [Planomonospora sp. ID82291]MBG0813759.1 neutral zinc metallopeptidase [Planomonospora sp. ID82291]
MRPRRSSPLVFGVFGVLATTFTAVVLVAALADGDEAAVPAGPGSAPTATERAVPAPAERAEVDPPTFSPPRRLDLGALGEAEIALAGGSTAADRTAGRRAAAVDLRYMQRSQTGVRLKRNPLYGTGMMRPTTCQASRPSAQAKDMLAFLNAATTCLDRAWAAKFSQARAVFQQPRRVFWTRPGRGPCGSYPASGAAAYYCPSNRGMYIGLSHLIEETGRIDPASNHVPYLSVLAHEYGHHVQSMAGIGGAWWWEVSAKSKTAQNAHSRRSELQAQCFAGAFMRTVRVPLGVTAARWQAVLEMEYSRGDDQNGLGRRDHGNGQNFAGWLDHGWKYARPGYCNTWTAPASHVG